MPSSRGDTSPGPIFPPPMIPKYTPSGPGEPWASTALRTGYKHNARSVAESNVPDSFELFLLGDGERKVTVTPDTRIPSSALFQFNKEDHTLANLLRARLLQSTHVTFAGYRVPHPLFATFELRVQTDGTITPKEALIQACKEIVQDLGILQREFTKEWELRKVAGQAGLE